MRPLAICLLSVLACHAVQVEDRDGRHPNLTLIREHHDRELGNGTTPPVGACHGRPLDFVFVIDSSRSVRPHDYEKVKTFISSVVRFLDVGPDAVRVGLLQYGSEVQNEFSLNAFRTRSQVQRAVETMEHLATGTMTGQAIQYTMEVAFSEEQGARPPDLRVPRIAMIVTDGRPQDTVEEVAARARQAGIQIYAIGVGRVDMSTLTAMGSEPHSEHVYLVANFSQIQMLTSVFQAKLCRDMCSVVDHQCDHVCISTPSSYMCGCRKHYVLNSDGKTCRAEDMCAVVEHECEHICANLPGAYECRCLDGYQLNKDNKTCQKIDFCHLANHGCEHYCVSTPESYICKCKKGYVLNPDGKNCSRIDQCGRGNHGCEHECVNADDSFVCKCRKGYTLRPNGKTCKKIDQCALGNHGCEHECMNAEDSFVCKCRKGYTLRPDGKTCKSLDVCLTVSHGCEQLCVSTNESYICKCVEGYTLRTDGKSCKKLECGDGSMDLVFVIDGSKSLGAANFELVKKFVTGIVEALNVSSDGTHVGLLQYSTKVRSEFNLGHYTTGRAIREAVSRMQYMGRGSMTGSALRHMFEVSFSAREGARPNVPRVSIVFTDGRSQDDVSQWAAKAHDDGITLYAVGVGKAIEEELKEIASKPIDKHLYYAKDFSRMGQITDKLKSRICKETPSLDDLCKCEKVLAFRNQTTEQLKKLTQKLEIMARRIETLENQLGKK